ncbi:MAG TPA: urea amidolyase associated protein UAAP1 [Polyangiaceae bacterium]|nr:urea amidolyase associated protein UAAP1 [Polyangiaceae bacterium]
MTEVTKEWLVDEPLRGGQMWSRVLKRGQVLRITDVEGGGAVAALLFNADRPLERYNMPDTLKAQHIARITAGNVLYSDMGRVLCSVIADSCGWHDTITGIESAAASVAKYGAGDYQTLRNDWHRNSRDNLLVELAKYGLGKRDFGPNLNLFVKVAVDSEGKLSWVPGNSKPGASIELRSEMNTLVVLSNTPHPLDPATTYRAKAVHLRVRAAGPVAVDDPCRVSCAENERGFALTEAYFL